MKIYIGNDHTGVEMKNAIVKHLKDNGYEVFNEGTNSTQAVDYPKYGMFVAKKVVNDPGSLGIVICGTGIGISISANKIKGAIASLVYETSVAEITRKHNNSNILGLGARMIAVEKAIEIVDMFIKTKFEGGRHEKRVNMLLGEIK